jgi:hypothetical protein
VQCSSNGAPACLASTQAQGPEFKPVPPKGKNKTKQNYKGKMGWRLGLSGKSSYLPGKHKTLSSNSSTSKNK